MTGTIFARASGGGRAAVAILRLSGPATLEMVEALCGGAPAPRHATLRRIRDPATRETLDHGLVLWFPGPASYTGEDCAELQLHGGVAVVEAVSRALIGLGACPAEPGEFTRRAFQNGRLDLTQAEAVADLIDAQSEGQRRQALDQLDGRLRDTAATWRHRLIDLLGSLEASVDFPDEELPAELAERCLAPMQLLQREFDAAARDRRGESIRTGVRIALVGAPNAGKSSLFNALIERDAAIVSPIAGTTRDVVEATVVIAGQLVTFADTAGQRAHTDDPIEREGIRRARVWSDAADLRLHVVAPGATAERDQFDIGTLRSDWVVLSQCDLDELGEEPAGEHRVSVTTRFGLRELRLALSRFVASLGGGEAVTSTRERHRIAFARAAEALERAVRGLSDGCSPELAAEDVRLAARALETLSGRIDAEDVLGRVFETFCIGK